MPWSKIWEERFVGQIGGGGLDRTLSILMHQNAGGLLAIFPICHLTQYLTSSAPIPSLVRIIIISWTGTYGASPDMQKHRNHDFFFLNTPLTVDEMPCQIQISQLHWNRGPIYKPDCLVA